MSSLENDQSNQLIETNPMITVESLQTQSNVGHFSVKYDIVRHWANDNNISHDEKTQVISIFSKTTKETIMNHRKADELAARCEIELAELIRQFVITLYHQNRKEYEVMFEKNSTVLCYSLFKAFYLKNYKQEEIDAALVTKKGKPTKSLHVLGRGWTDCDRKSKIILRTVSCDSIY